MKKFIFVIVLITSSFFIMSCKNERTEQSISENSNSQVSVQKQLTPPIINNTVYVATPTPITDSDGYLGHWYTDIPFTGGNNTTIEIKDMSDTSVSFNLYLTDIYSYQGINVKLENNIAKFIDIQGNYAVRGTIEFANKNIIVNIEKTNRPNISEGKTVFKYKVSNFEPVQITPDNGAKEVDLRKGIEIEFDRKISSAIDPSEYITKSNVLSNLADGFVEMTVEIEGNKLILFPDYDAMNTYNEVIEPGEKYVLSIAEGRYIDDVGNINSEIKLEFTTK